MEEHHVTIEWLSLGGFKHAAAEPVARSLLKKGGNLVARNFLTDKEGPRIRFGSCRHQPFVSSCIIDKAQQFVVAQFLKLLTQSGLGNRVFWVPLNKIWEQG